MDKKRRQEFAIDRAKAQVEWAELNAWALLEYGPGWLKYLDQEAIVNEYRVYSAMSLHTPTMHWAGEMAAPRGYPA